MGLALLGCESNAPPLTPGEQALINLTEQLKSEGGVTKLLPRYCDGGASGRPELLCYADVMEPYAGEERKVGFSTYSCDVAPGGHCVIASAADLSDASAAPAERASTCAEPLHKGLTIDLPDAGVVTVSDSVTGGAPGQAWVNVSVTLQDAGMRLTESQVKEALDRLLARITDSCGTGTLVKTRIFLYPTDVIAGESANWIARLDDGAHRSVDINRAVKEMCDC